MQYITDFTVSAYGTETITPSHLRLKHTMSDLFSGLGDVGQYMYASEDQRGFASQIALGQDLRLFVSEMDFLKDTEMSYQIGGDAFLLSFCLGDDMDWVDQGDSKEYYVQDGQYTIYRRGEYKEKRLFREGRHYQGMTLFVQNSRMESVIEGAGLNSLHPFLQGEVHPKFEMSARGLSAIHEAMHCGYTGGLKSTFLESRMLDILVDCIVTAQEQLLTADEIFLRSLTRSDRLALQEARMHLDLSGGRTITIAELSRKCAINEFKLKSGFKALYGKTIHQYIVSARMKQAVKLLREKYTVEEVAEKTGYSTVSGFYKAFKKEFGYLPGEISGRKARRDSY